MTEEADAEPTRGHGFPLNSRKLTGAIVGRIAANLGLPTGGSLKDTRQMIEGALTDSGREPRNVEVYVTESEEGIVIRLEDDGGVFMELLPDKDTREGGANAATEEESESVNGGGESAEGGVPEGDRRIEETEELLRKANAMITELREEVSVLRGEMEGSKVEFER